MSGMDTKETNKLLPKDIYILPDMTDLKADKHRNITLQKKQMFWDWLSSPKQKREPKTKEDCSKRLGVTIQTLDRWRQEWLQYSKSTDIVEIKTTPQEVATILEKKLADMQPLIDSQLSESFVKESPKQAMLDISSLAFWLVLSKSSVKLMNMIDNIDDIDTIIKLIEKVGNTLQKIDSLGINILESGKAFVKAKKSFTYSETVSGSLLSGCNLPKPEQEQPEVIETEIIDDTVDGEDSNED